jgi:hypothetical protein
MNDFNHDPTANITGTAGIARGNRRDIGKGQGHPAAGRRGWTNGDGWQFPHYAGVMYSWCPAAGSRGTRTHPAMYARSRGAKAIDRETYDQERDKLEDDISLAKLRLKDAQLDEVDIEAILNFAEKFLLNTPRI